MVNRLSKELLIKLRNEIPIEELITHMLNVPWKHSEGYFRFLCPICYDFNTAIKRETNLGRCFRCNKNFNPIDLVMAYLGLNFLDTVKFLIPILAHYHKVK